MENPRLKHKLAPFYNEVAVHPELPKFRTLGPQWTKKLFDDMEEVLRKEKVVDDALAKKYGKAVMTVLNCPRSLIRDDPDVYRKWKEYENSMQTYSEGLCLAHQVYKLPSHSLYFGKYLKKYEGLFENEIFVPTGEQAIGYQDPSCPGFCALVGIPGGDNLTIAYVNNSDWIEKHVLGRLRRLWRRQRPVQRHARISLATITSSIDFITCIFVPLLLMAVMFALVSVQPLKARIALVGVFGLIFASSAKVFTGRISRGEIFAYTAAFFAISSVFVGTTSGGVVEGS